MTHRQCLTVAIINVIAFVGLIATAWANLDTWDSRTCVAMIGLATVCAVAARVAFTRAIQGD